MDPAMVSLPHIPLRTILTVRLVEVARKSDPREMIIAPAPAGDTESGV